MFNEAKIFGSLLAQTIFKRSFRVCETRSHCNTTLIYPDVAIATRSIAVVMNPKWSNHGCRRSCRYSSRIKWWNSQTRCWNVRSVESTGISVDVRVPACSVRVVGNFIGVRLDLCIWNIAVVRVLKNIAERDCSSLRVEHFINRFNAQAGQLDYLCNVIGELEDTLKSERLQTELSQERKDKA